MENGVLIKIIGFWSYFSSKTLMNVILFLYTNCVLYIVWYSMVAFVHLFFWVRIISKFIRIKHFNYSHFLTP